MYGESVELTCILSDPSPHQEGFEQQDPHDQRFYIPYFSS